MDTAIALLILRVGLFGRRCRRVTHRRRVRAPQEGAFPYLISHIKPGFGCSRDATGHAAGARSPLHPCSFDISEAVVGGGAEDAVHLGGARGHEVETATGGKYVEKSLRRQMDRPLQYDDRTRSSVLAANGHCNMPHGYLG